MLYLRGRGLSCGVVCVILLLAVLVELRLVPERRTDRLIDIGPWLVPSRGNKRFYQRGKRAALSVCVNGPIQSKLLQIREMLS